jgi:hypothetical protein
MFKSGFIVSILLWLQELTSPASWRRSTTLKEPKVTIAKKINVAKHGRMTATWVSFLFVACSWNNLLVLRPGPGLNGANLQIIFTDYGSFFVHAKLEEENIDDQDDILEVEEVCAFSWGRGATRCEVPTRRWSLSPRVSLKGTRPPLFDILYTTPHYGLLKPHHGSGAAVTLH